MRTRIASSTYGSDPLPSLFSHISIPICGSSLISSIGMTKQCYMSNITGNRQGRRISHMNSCGTRPGTRTTGSITTTTGLFTFLRPLLSHFLQTLSYLYFGCKPESIDAPLPAHMLFSHDLKNKYNDCFSCVQSFFLTTT